MTRSICHSAVRINAMRRHSAGQRRARTLVKAGWLFSSLILSILAQQPTGSQDLEERIDRLNRQLIASGASTAESSRLLGERAVLMKEAIRRIPGKTPLLALPQATLERFAAAGADPAVLEASGEWKGELDVLVEDDFDRGVSRTRHILRGGGRDVELHFSGTQPEPQCGQLVTVKGTRLADDVAVERFATDGIVPQAAACTTLGSQPTVVLLVSFPSLALPAHVTPSFVHNAFFGTAGRSLDGYWREASYGLASATGAVYGPYLLPANYDCTQTSQIRQDAIAAADPQVDFSIYTRIFIVMPSPAGCAFGGLGSLGCGTSADGGVGSTSWLTTFATTATDGLAYLAMHEGGHNLSLHHASTLDFGAEPLGPLGATGSHVEYGDLFSTMGSSWGHYAAPHKSKLGWLSSSNTQTIEAPGAFVLLPYETPTTGLQTLRVRRGAGNNLWLWLEYRQQLGLYDNSLPLQGYTGALVHYEDPTATSYVNHTRLLDFTPSATPNSFGDAALANRSWSDPYSLLTLVAGGAAPSGLNITVNYDTPCATLAPTSATHPPGGGNGTIGVSAPGTCSWVAVSTVGWITITSSASGTGSSTVSYSVAANTGNSARTGIIAIARQSFAVNQQGPPQAISVTPSGGSGASQTFSFVFSDSSAYSNLPWAEVNISATQTSVSACQVRYEQPANSMLLRNDAGTAWIGPIVVGSGALENSQCVVSGGGSAASGSGANLTLNVAVSFKTVYQGGKNVYMQTQDNTGLATGWQQRGTWTVNGAPAMISVSPSSGSGATQTFRFTFSNPGGYAGLSYVYLLFNLATTTGNACYLYYNQPSNYLALANDTGNSFNSSVTPGVSGTAQNSQCIVYGAVSAVNGAGDILTLDLAISFKGTFTGTKNIYMSGYNAQYTFWQLRGAWTVILSPLALSVTPNSGSGTSSTFAFAYSEPSGFANLPWAEMNINSTAALTNSCYLRYEQATNSVLLRNDTDTLWSAPLVLTGNGTLENSQCLVSSGGSSAPGAADLLTVNLALSFKSAFQGNKYIYMRTQNAASVATGWQLRGTWTVNAAPATVSVIPGSGSGAAQTFRFTFWIPGGYAGLNYAYLLFNNSTSSTANSCYLYYYRSANYLALAGDSGSSFTGSVTPGTGGTAQNSQCAIYGAASAVNGSGDTLTLDVGLSFKAAFSGLKNVYMSGYASQYTSWQLRGTWMVTSSPLALSVTPSSGTGTSSTFAFAYSEPSGYTNLPWAEMNINSTSASINSCYLRYEQATNSVQLRNDADNTWSASLALAGSGTLENSQCVVSSGGSSASGTLELLTVNLALSFKGAFQGNKNIYMQTQNAAAVATGWQLRGNWTINGAPAMVSVTPGSGSGVAQTFRFTFLNPGGYAGFNYAYLLFNTTTSVTNACYIYYYRPSNSVGLANDTSTSFIFVTLGSTGTAQNSQCIINGTGSAASGSGDLLTLDLAVSFKPGFAGIKNVYMQGSNSTLFTPWQLRGTWTVPGSNINITTSPAGRSIVIDNVTYTAPQSFIWVTGSTHTIGVSSPQGGTSTRYVFANWNDGGAQTHTVTAAAAPATFTANFTTQHLLALAVSPSGGGTLTANPASADGFYNAGTTVQLTAAASTNFAFAGFSGDLTGATNPQPVTITTPRTVSANFTPVTGNRVPQASSASPASGAGASATITFAFADPDGWQDLDVVNILINNFLDGRQACYLAYSRPSNVLYLVTDAGGGLLPGLVLNGSGSTANSQCTVQGVGSSATGSGTTLTLTLNLSFAATFGGNRIQYLAARDLAGNNSGWQALGVWQAPGGASTSPAVVSQNPARGSAANQTFTFTFSDSGGWQNLGVINVLVNNFLDGRQACYLAYSRQYNVLYLVDDPGSGLLPGLVLNGTGSISNSQCTVFGAGSSISGSGNSLALTLNIQFRSSFAGNRVFYLAARDAADVGNSGWQAKGTWSVP